MQKIEKKHTEDKRFYRIHEDGMKEPMYIPSVTTILGAVRYNSVLDNWNEEQAEKVGVIGKRLELFLAAQRGTNVHNVIEGYNLRQMTQENTPVGWEIHTDDEWRCINRYHNWFHERQPRVLGAECNVYSKEKWYAGQLDAVMEICPPKKRKTDPDPEVGTYIVDFKTGKDIYEDAEEQVAAYVVAYEEMHKVKVDGALVLALRAKNEKGWKERYIPREQIVEKNQEERDNKNIDYFFQGFMLRKAYFDHRNPDFNPKRDLLPKEIYPLISPFTTDV